MMYEIQADVFLNAQDSDLRWLETLIVSKDFEVNSLYNVSFCDKNSKEQNRIKLFVVKEKNGYKINEIEISPWIKYSSSCENFSHPKG